MDEQVRIAAYLALRQAEKGYYDSFYFVEVDPNGYENLDGFRTVARRAAQFTARRAAPAAASVMVAATGGISNSEGSSASRDIARVGNRTNQERLAVKKRTKGYQATNPGQRHSAAKPAQPTKPPQGGRKPVSSLVDFSASKPKLSSDRSIKRQPSKPSFAAEPTSKPRPAGQVSSLVDFSRNRSTLR